VAEFLLRPSSPSLAVSAISIILEVLLAIADEKNNIYCDPFFCKSAYRILPISAPVCLTLPVGL
jgi:hypothetical protein